MSSSDDDIILLWGHLRRRKVRKNRNVWVHPSLTSLVGHGANVCAKELSKHPLHFKNCYRISPEGFQTVLNLVAPKIRKRDTNYREAISSTERLLITLR